MMRITPVQHEQARVAGDRRAWQGKLLNDSQHSGGVCGVHKIGASKEFAGSAASPFEHASHSVRRAGACTLPVSAAGDHSPGQDFASSIERASCAHRIELALHCVRQSFTSFKHHGRLGVPGSTGTARLLVVAARRTAALEAVNAVLGPDERLPARPGGRG